MGNSSVRSQQYWDTASNKMYVNALLSTSLAPGYCLDSWFDWYTPEGRSHYDARGARTCQNNYSMYGSVVTESYTMRGMQKAGGAYGPNDNTVNNYHIDASGSTLSITTINDNMSHTNCSIRYWKRLSNGQIDYWAGGSSVSASCS